MDARNRLTKISEWEEGADYEFLKGKNAAGTYRFCGFVYNSSGDTKYKWKPIGVMFNTPPFEISCPIICYNWRGRFRKKTHEKAES